MSLETRSSDDYRHNFIQQIKVENSIAKQIKNLLKEEEKGQNVDLPLAKIFAPYLEKIKHQFRAIIIELLPDGPEILGHQDVVKITPKIGSMLGQLLVQNEQGDKVVHVYDRNRLGSMWQGSRYHQTREGGSIHTDNVNVPEIWDYLVLSCVSPALVGGENILVDGVHIHHLLKTQYPDALKILEQNFVWEMRGLADALYHAPIITYDAKGAPLFRHLRPYMESAHQKAQTPLSEEQLYAIDVLDALTNSSENQLRYKMKKGDVLISYDTQVLHGRTCFSDAFNAVSFPEYIEGRGTTLKRTMERLWVKKI